VFLEHDMVRGSECGLGLPTRRTLIQAAIMAGGMSGDGSFKVQAGHVAGAAQECLMAEEKRPENDDQYCR
jgi:hypothetical protein